MEKLQGHNRSYWRAMAKGVSYPKLAKDIEVDTTVVGGGISGILTAYLLAKHGQKVALLEAREFVSGTTGGTTAKLSSQHQLIYNEMMRRDGNEIAKLFYEANEEGRKLIESLIQHCKIDCGFEQMDSYVFTQDANQKSSFKDEANAYEQLGIDGELTNSIPFDYDIVTALVMRNQAQFHPIKFLHGILREFESLGGKIHQHTMYMGTERGEGGLILSTDTPYTVKCKQVVLATLFPAEDPHSFYSKTLKPVTSHLTAFASPKPFDSGMFISDDTPKRTFRGAQDDDRHVLIVGGETHPTGDSKSTIAHYEAIRDFAKVTFGLTEMLDYWSEHELVTPDRRPFIGRIEEGDDQMYIMTGYSKWGLAAAATGAQLITDMIVGEQNRFEDLFSPQRKQPKEQDTDDENEEQTEAKSKQKETSISIQAEQLGIGQACTTEIDGKPAGIYKDVNGNIHYVDLACTHLGCEVKWNDGDHTWDCPCHGSVFDGMGKVVAGPAKLPLKNVNPF